MTKTTVLVDYRWVLYRSAFRFNEFVVDYKGTSLHTGAIYGVLELTKSILDSYKNVKVIFCLDGEPKERMDLLPSYKQKRKEADPKDEITHARSLHDEPIKILSIVPNVQFIKDSEKEADDLIAMMAFKEKGLGNNVIVFTGDKDMLQLMQFGIRISKSLEEGKLQLLNDNYITLHDNLGCSQEEVLYFRALDGDKSDEIPAALGGNKELKREFARIWHESGDRYLENFPSILEKMEPIIESMFKGKKAQTNNRDKLKTIKEDAVRNIKLMELDRYKEILDYYKKYKETKDKSVLKPIKEKYLNNIKVQDYDMGTEDVLDIIEMYELQRFLAWARHNDYL